MSYIYFQNGINVLKKETELLLNISFEVFKIKTQ